MSTRSTLIGTSHFISREAAIRYYQPYEKDPVEAVRRKLAEGLIHIGLPERQPGEGLEIIDDGTRYAIRTVGER